MKTEWDYTALAAAYPKRAGYAAAAVDALVGRTGVHDGSACDIGAGTGILTRMLAERGHSVVAIEPNEAMRAIGIAHTREYDAVRWIDATGEHTEQDDATFELVTFGSSFNVCDAQQALREAARILRPGGWLACLWNHRVLDDPLQRRIQEMIEAHVPGYAHGTRRDDQAPVIAASGRYAPARRVEVAFTHRQSIADCVEAWHSHATLARQAGIRFGVVIGLIEDVLRSYGSDPLLVPYTTVVTVAQIARSAR